MGQQIKLVALIHTVLYHDPGIQRVNESHLPNKDIAAYYSQLSEGHAASLP